MGALLFDVLKHLPLRKLVGKVNFSERKCKEIH